MTQDRKTALITGAAIRVGREIALSLAEQGYDIALHYRTSESEAEETAREILATGRTCDLFQCDLNDLQETTTLIPAVMEQCENLCVLVNNASVYEECGFLDTDPELYQRQMNINLGAPFFLTRDFATYVRQGVVVNIGDTHVTRLRTKHFAYLLSKKGLIDFTRMAAHALGPNIRVNAVCPGLTELHEALDSDPILRKIAMLPLQRVTPLSDIVHAVLTLIESPYMTGQIVYTDGGEHVIY